MSDIKETNDKIEEVEKEQTEINEEGQEAEAKTEPEKESESVADVPEEEPEEMTEEDTEEETEEKPEEVQEEATEQPKKGRFRLWHIPVAFVGVLVLVYLCVSLYFINHFYIHTEISGNDCSGKTIESVIKQLEKQASEYSLTIVERDGHSEVIYSEEIGLSHELGDVLKQAMKKQNPFLWVTALFQTEGEQVHLEMKYDEQALAEKIESLHCMSEEMQVSPIMAQPVFNGTTYEIAEEVLGTAIDKTQFQQVIDAAIGTLTTEIRLDEEACYVAPTYTASSPEVVEANRKAVLYSSAKVTYKSGNQTMEVAGEQIAEWIQFDEKMQLSFDNQAMKKYVQKVAKKFNTVGTVRTIKTPTGKKAEVSGGTYGRVVDQEKEFKLLKKNIKEGETVTRAPESSQNVASDGKYEWGNTYLEVDITEQHMWYIKKGKVVFESDVVTGSPNPERATPQGVYTILEKLRNKVLRGEIQPNGKPEYETPVSYWMRVTWSGIGFHDATWQRAFGGERYKQGYGSHGCINMPLSGVAELYELVKKGCPVIIHY